MLPMPSSSTIRGAPRGPNETRHRRSADDAQSAQLRELVRDLFGHAGREIGFAAAEIFSNGSTASRQGRSAGAALDAGASAGRWRATPHQNAAAARTTPAIAIPSIGWHVSAESWRRRRHSPVRSVGQRFERRRGRGRSGTGSRAPSRDSAESPGRVLRVRRHGGSRDRSGCSFKIAWSVSIRLSPENARRADAISKRTQPNEKMSDRLSIRSPRACSATCSRRSEQHALLGLRRRVASSPRPVGLGGEPEVEQLYLAVTGDEDVLRLEIAMDDAAIVGGGQAAPI